MKVALIHFFLQQTTKTNKTAKTKTTFFVQLKLMYKKFVNFNL